MLPKYEDTLQKCKNEDIYCTVFDNLGTLYVGPDASLWSLNHCFESSDPVIQLFNSFNYSIQCSGKTLEKTY